MKKIKRENLHLLDCRGLPIAVQHISLMLPKERYSDVNGEYLRQYLRVRASVELAKLGNPVVLGYDVEDNKRFFAWIITLYFIPRARVQE